jgi:hypothetical protein
LTATVDPDSDSAAPSATANDAKFIIAYPFLLTWGPRSRRAEQSSWGLDKTATSPRRNWPCRYDRRHTPYLRQTTEDGSATAAPQTCPPISPAFWPGTANLALFQRDRAGQGDRGRFPGKWGDPSSPGSSWLVPAIHAIRRCRRSQGVRRIRQSSV